MLLDVAIATTRPLPEPDPDQPLLLDALRARGLTVAMVPWHDGSAPFAEARVTVLRSTWDYAWFADAFVAWLDEVAQVTSLWNPVETCLWNVHKRYLLALAEQGVPVVPTRLVERGSTSDLASLVADLGARRVVVKPAIGAGSYETWAMDADGLDEATYERLVSERDTLVQPYVDSIHTHGERSLVFIDGALSHVMRKEPRFAGGVEQVTGPWPVEPVEREVAEAALSAAGAHALLYARVDLVRGANGQPMVSELELLEPSLFLAQHRPALDAIADGIAARVRPH